MNQICEKSVELAYKLFRSNQHDWSINKTLHYSFLFRRNKLVSIGQNSYDMDSKALYFAERFNISQKKKWPTLHSEVDAISKIWSKIHIDRRLRLVNVRFTKSGQLGLSKPCPDCKEVLDALGVIEIYWSTGDGFNK